MGTKLWQFRFSRMTCSAETFATSSRDYSILITDRDIYFSSQEDTGDHLDRHRLNMISTEQPFLEFPYLPCNLSIVSFATGYSKTLYPLCHEPFREEWIWFNWSTFRSAGFPPSLKRPTDHSHKRDWVIFMLWGFLPVYWLWFIFRRSL